MAKKFPQIAFRGYFWNPIGINYSIGMFCENLIIFFFYFRQFLIDAYPAMGELNAGFKNKNSTYILKIILRY
jgi:hypothetical protein